MFGHLPELVIILVIALIVFGPEKLPEVAGNVGRMVREVRSAMDVALNPQDVSVPDDFATYYQESLARHGDGIDVPGADEDATWDPMTGPHPADPGFVQHAEAGLESAHKAEEPAEAE